MTTNNKLPESFSGCGYFLYAYRIGQDSLIELIVFNHIRADIFYSLLKDDTETVFTSDIKEISELITYVYNRDPQVQGLDETEIFEAMTLLKQKGLITKFKKEGDIFKYRISDGLTVIAKEEVKLIEKMIGKDGISNASKNYIKFIQFALFKVKTGTKSTEFNGVPIAPGELFAGKTRISRELGIGPEDTIELIQKAVESSFIEVVEWMTGEGSRGNFTYPKYYLKAKYKNGEDLFTIPFAGSNYEKNVKLGKNMPIEKVVDALRASKNEFITIEESKIVQRNLDNLLPKDDFMDYEKRLILADKITDAMAKFEVNDLAEAFIQIHKEHDKERFTDLKLMYKRLVKLLDKDLRKTLEITIEDDSIEDVFGSEDVIEEVSLKDEIEDDIPDEFDDFKV